MKKLFLAMGILAICITSISQDIQHEAVAVNIEVPVRVFKGDTFIDNLTMDDFELYEEGVLQNIEAVYLIKKTRIENEDIGNIKSEARKKIISQVNSRLFVLSFEIIDYAAKIGEVIDYFFNEVFSPGDSLIAVTPLKTYEFESEALRIKRKEQVASELKKKLKKDTKIGNAEYKSIIRDIIAGRATEFEYQRLKYLRYLEESKLLFFADYLKSIEGQKHVFLFFQEGVIPKLFREDILNTSFHDFSEIDITFDITKVKHAFSDSLITAHFLFLTNTEHMALDMNRLHSSVLEFNTEGTTMNVFSAFSEISKVTGGLRESSANPVPMFKKTVEASENYYLLYYTPKDYKADGKFKNIKIKIKEKKYKVLHRAGYIAD